MVAAYGIMGKIRYLEKVIYMKEKKKKESGKVFWKILFVFTALIFLAVLELGKNTVSGWITAVLVLAGFCWLRGTKLSASAFGVRFLAWAGLLALCAAIYFVSYPPVKAVPAVEGKDPSRTEVVRTAKGDVRGVVTEDGKAEVFAGIPYAKPPVGDLRWKETVEADPWEGVLEADHFAPMSMQVVNHPLYDSLARIIGFHDYKISLKDNYLPPVSEDSLYINLWRPAKAAEGDKLPVLVYIHGGSLQTGQPWYKDYSGESLAQEGVIVVNMGYRLGIFGFFADEELQTESENGTTGNYGLLDQIMALRWVQENIEYFGGDPGNVTLAGESAGSACVSALCTSPLAKGLFRRVILESSTVSAPRPAHSYRLLESALKASGPTKERFGVKDIEGLRAVPAEKLASEMNYHHHITIDGYVLEESPYESYRKGIHNEEAQLQGFNREEAAPFILFSQANMKNYMTKLQRAFGESYAEKVFELYPASTDTEAKRYWADIDTVLLFAYGHYCLGRQAFANGIPCYMYHFTKDNGRLGSWHSGEEVYLYGNIPEKSRLYDESDRKLSKAFSSYVLNYVKTGDPNGAGLENWPLFDGNNELLELGDTVKKTKVPYLELFSVMDEAYLFELD